MKIGIYGDNTLALPIQPLCDALNSICTNVQFSAGRMPVRLNGSNISHPDTYVKFPTPLKEEVKTFDLAVICTTIPYDNNFFYEGFGNAVIISFSGWNLLTDLPITNGLIFIIASMLCDEDGIGDTHHENTGCINDFLWDKRGIDVGMRAAFICGECRESCAEKSPSLIKDIESMLDLVASSSRARADILSCIPQKENGIITNFDVFLCHNSEDKAAIRKINSEFKAAGIKTWLDEEQLSPGSPWQVELEKQIKAVRSVCVFVGENGFGPWQDMEVRAFLSQFVKRGCPVMPVILPSAVTVPELPIFLQEMMWVDLRKDYGHGLARLIGALKRPA